MKTNEYLDLSDKALEKVLKDYAYERKGEIADLCYAASIRIGVLSAYIKKFREESEDDGK